MTSIDPSHFAALGVGSSHDRTHGGATHPARLDTIPSSLSTEIDEEDAPLPSPTSSFFNPKELPHRLSSLQLPDLRFEQGYLMSLMPFFHFRPAVPPEPLHKKTAGNPHTSSEPFVFGLNEPVEATTDVSLAEADDYYFGSNFYVEWKMVVYVTLRDQLFYPLLQGCLWGSASNLVSHLWKLRANGRARPRLVLSKQSLAPLRPKPTTIWDRFMNTIWGGIQTNVTLS